MKKCCKAAEKFGETIDSDTYLLLALKSNNAVSIHYCGETPKIAFLIDTFIRNYPEVAEILYKVEMAREMICQTEEGKA